MARSTLDILVYATILIAPMLTAVGYIAWTPVGDPAVATGVERFEPVLVARPMFTEAQRAIAVPVAPIQPVLEDIPHAPAPIERAADRPAAHPTSGAGMLLYDGQLVLHTDPRAVWARGKLQAHDRDGSIAASKSVEPTRLPDTLAPLLAARVVVYDTDGSSCTTTTGAMTIYARQDGDVIHLDEVGETISPARLLAARKQVFADPDLLLARQVRGDDDGPGRDCQGPWARRADLPTPAVFGRVTLDEPSTDVLRGRVLAQLEDLPAIATLRAAYEADNREQSVEMQVEWPIYRDQTLVVSRWDEVGGGRSVVNVEVGDGGESCSSIFSEQRALLFALRGGVLEPLAQEGFLGPLALMDLERDGVLEAVTDEGRRLGNIHETIQEYRFNYVGCGC